MIPRIAISGAGPGGLTLARILQRNSIPTSVFERDPSPDYRPQGGTLDLHVRSGQQAIRQAGLWDEFLKHARYDAQVMKMTTKSGELVFQPNSDGARRDEHARPEIDRTVLRTILLEAFGTENVAWDHALASVQPAADNKYDLRFKNGKVETGFDLVVGADGAWSRVRPLLTSAAPSYSGISFIELDVLNPQGEKYDAINKLVGAGSASAFGDGKAIMGQRLGTGTIRVYAGYNTELGEADWLDKFDTSNPSALKTKLLTYFQGWSSDFQDLIRLSDDDSVLKRPLHAFPIGHSWESRPGLTLIGDAAHLMTPFAGEGVNLAMWDSLELSREIIAGVQSGNLNEQVREYEVNMFKTVAESASRTDRNKVAMFSKDFPVSMAQMIREMRGGQNPRSESGEPAKG